ncbi:MAG: hypothetical protein V3V23_00245 [Dehalococcoidales bacterium]
MRHAKSLPVVVIACLLSLLALLVSGTPALAAPMITVTPESGAIGTMVTVIGTNFESYRGDDIFIFFDSEEITTSPLVVPQAGSFTFNFNIPGDTEPGEHQIRAKNELTTLALVSFIVTSASITLDYKSGFVGSTVIVEGRGFYADRVVTLYFYNPAKEMLDTRPAGSTGEFSYSFIVPESSAGKHRVVVVNAEGNSAEFEFRVLPLIGLNPASGAIGEILTVNGKGFGQRSDVAIYFEYAEVAYAKTDELGKFEAAFFNVPKSPPGTYEVRVQDGDGNTVKAKFTVITGASLDRTAGSVGMDLTVSGTGFIVGGEVAITYDGVTITTATADSFGAFEIAFDVPVGRYGDHTVTVTDGENSKEFTFVMESDAPLAPGLLVPVANSDVKARAGVDWGDVVDPSPPVSYHLQVASDADFVNLVLEKMDLVASQYEMIEAEKLSAVEEDAPYFWRVKAIDGAANEGEWSAPGSFLVAAPPAPALLLPQEGLKADAPVYLDWKDVTNLDPPVTYHLQVASDADFANLVLEKMNLSDSEYTVTEEEKLDAVREDVPYYWRVKAIDSAANEGEWSAPGTFHVGFAFALPGWAIYLLIAIAALLIGFITFLWGRRTAYQQE